MQSSHLNKSGTHSSGSDGACASCSLAANCRFMSLSRSRESARSIALRACSPVLHAPELAVDGQHGVAVASEASMPKLLALALGLASKRILDRFSLHVSPGKRRITALNVSTVWEVRDRCAPPSQSLSPLIHFVLVGNL